MKLHNEYGSFLNIITHATVIYYIWDLSVIREILMNKHMLKYIHFIEYTVCMIEGKNDCYKSILVTFPKLAPWSID